MGGWSLRGRPPSAKSYKQVATNMKEQRPRQGSERAPRGVLLHSQIEGAAKQVATDLKEQGHGSERAPRGVLLLSQIEEAAKQVATDMKELGPRSCKTTGNKYETTRAETRE